MQTAEDLLDLIGRLTIERNNFKALLTELVEAGRRHLNQDTTGSFEHLDEALAKAEKEMGK